MQRRQLLISALALIGGGVALADGYAQAAPVYADASDAKCPGAPWIEVWDAAGHKLNLVEMADARAGWRVQFAPGGTPGWPGRESVLGRIRMSWRSDTPSWVKEAHRRYEEARAAVPARAPLI